MEEQKTVDAQQIELIVKDGKPVVSSLLIAEHFERNHKDVIRGIRELMDDDDPEFTERNFALSEYLDSTGRSLPMYHLTRDGFMLVVMGYTGKEALRMKKAYIRRFNEMEAYILGKGQGRPARDALNAEDKAFYPHRPVSLSEWVRCSDSKLRGIRGLLDFWAHMDGITHEEAEARLCTAIPVSSLDQLARSEQGIAWQFLWRAIFNATGSGPAASDEQRRPLDGLLDYWEYCGGENRINVNNAVCQTCKIADVRAVPEKAVNKAILVAFMSILRNQSTLEKRASLEAGLAE